MLHCPHYASRRIILAFLDDERVVAESKEGPEVAAAACPQVGRERSLASGACHALLDLLDHVGRNRPLHGLIRTRHRDGVCYR